MKQKITYWKESDGKYLGYLNDYPEHWTQGENLEDLKEHLLDLYREFSTGDLPGIKKLVESLKTSCCEGRDESSVVQSSGIGQSHRTV